MTLAADTAPEADAPEVDRTLFSITNDASGYDVARLSPGREPEETGQDLPSLEAAVDAAKDRGAYGELMTPEEAFAPSLPSDGGPAGQTAEPAFVPAAPQAEAPTEKNLASFDDEEANPYAASPAEEFPVSTGLEAAAAQYDGGATQGTGAGANPYADAVEPADVDPIATWGSSETDWVAPQAPAAQAAEIADVALGEAATPLMDEVGATTGGFPSSAGEILGNTGAYEAPPSTVDEAGWTSDGSDTAPAETAPVADGTATQGGASTGQGAWVPDSEAPAVSPIAAYDDDTSDAPVAQAPVAEAGQYEVVGAATPQATDAYGLDDGGAAATEDVWQVEDASAPANEAVEAPAAQPELSGYEASWTPTVDDGTAVTGYGADEGYYSGPYDDGGGGSTYDVVEAPADSYPYDAGGGASSWEPTQDVAVQEGSIGADPYAAGTVPAAEDPYATDTVPAAQDPATVATADTLGDAGTSDASYGGGSTWQTSPDLSAWGDDGSGGSFQEEAAPVVSAPADAGFGGSFESEPAPVASPPADSSSGGSLESAAPVEQTSAPSDDGADLSGGGSDLSSSGGDLSGGDTSQPSTGGGGSSNDSSDGSGDGAGDTGEGR